MADQAVEVLQAAIDATLEAEEGELTVETDGEHVHRVSGWFVTEYDPRLQWMEEW